MMTPSQGWPRVLFSPACERNKGPILAVLQQWLPARLAAGSRLPAANPLDVTAADQWPRGKGPGTFDAVFSANTCHIMPAAALPQLLAGAAAVLGPGGLLLLYGPFHHGGVHTAASNAAFDAHLRRLDPAMGVRDALERQR